MADALREGRAILANIREGLHYSLSLDRVVDTALSAVDWALHDDGILRAVDRQA
jgi:hypothetical protein